VARDVYSLRIFAAGSLTNGVGTVGPIVPDGLVYIVRDMDAFSDTAGATDNLVVFNQLGGILWDLQGSLQPQGGNWQWRGRQVYNEGEQVAVRAFVGTWAIAISGYQLGLP
jgi:hypothetical protein